MKSLETLLLEYNDSDYYGFHMPGHKRNTHQFGNDIPYMMDITEIDGFDDLHHADGILKKAQERAANVFKSSESCFLINGSTVGLLSSILGVTHIGDKIIVARNNHKSVYNAMLLNHLNPIYVYPTIDSEYGIMGEIKAKDIDEMLLKETDIKAVVIVSPTYEGVISDVKGIAEVTHRHGVPLIVDEAHGAHLGFDEYFASNSNTLGADIVIHSVHKTLPSLTQTGLIHMNGNLINRSRVRKYLKMLQSSSPSYVLMASIEKCVRLLEEEKDNLFANYIVDLEKCRKQLKNLNKLELIDYTTELFRYDRSKIVISTKNTTISGNELSRILLDNYHLQMEMSGIDYVLAMTSVGDTKAGFDRLVFALREIDNKLEVRMTSNDNIKMIDIFNTMKSMNHLSLEDRLNDEFYYIYPPGIPLVAPGEEMTEELESLIELYKKHGFVVHKS